MSTDYSYRKQATLCPGRASTKAGCSVLQRSVQCGHLDASGQPFMSPMGLGISPVSAMVCAKDQITFFVFVPPYMEIERRRKLIKVLDEAANKAVGYRGELKNIVIFKYHDDEACGVDGVLRADAKAAAEK